jgi:hypothetical protein
MNSAYVFTCIAAAAIVIYLVSSIMIYDQLKKKNLKVSFIFLRFLIPFYAHKYKKLTEAETGNTGRLFYCWIISINTALISSAAAVIPDLI